MNQWENQIAYERKKTVLEQRVKLLEKLSRLANSASKMRAYNDYLVLQADLAQIYAACEKKKEKGCTKPDETKLIAETNIKRAELNSEFSSTLQLIKVYFGLPINSELSDLALRKDWWAPDVEPRFGALIDVASQEINAL